MAPFFNKETVANAYFAGVEAAYAATKVTPSSSGLRCAALGEVMQLSAPG